MDEKTAAAGTHAHAGGCFFCDTAMPMLENLVSATTRDHFRNSRVEFLKGMRSLPPSLRCPRRFVRGISRRRTCFSET